MDPEKRPAEATESGPTEPVKRVRKTRFPEDSDPINWLHSDQGMVPEKRPAEATESVKRVRKARFPEDSDPIVGVYKGRSHKDHIKGRDLYTFARKIIQEPDPESVIKAAITFVDEDSEALGDDPPTKIMQEKPEAAGETDKKPPSKCLLCGKITHDHNFWDCPNREWVWKVHAYCMVCNEGGHDHSDCAKATEDVLKNLRFCSICDKNTDHDTFDCKKDNAFVLIDGVKIPNVCDLCRQVGHRGKDCSYNCYDLQYGLDDPSMDF